ncbi:MAG: glycosyltransferase family 4 protein [Phormidesmis sp.]
MVHLSTIHQPLDVRIFMKECRTLAAHGYEVHLVVRSPPSDKKDGVTFWPIKISPDARKIEQLWQRYRGVWQQAWQLDGDLYHFHDTELIPLGLVLKLKGARVIYDVHEDAPREARSLNKKRPLFGLIKSFVWRFLEFLAKRFLDRFVCVTPAIAAKFPPTKTHLVRNFPLLSECQIYQQQRSYGDRDNLIVYAGGITEIRGIQQMVAALPHLPQPLNSRLLLLGTFSPPSLEFEMQQRSGWRQVTFLGWCDRPTMISQVSRARVGLVLFHPEIDHLEAMPNKLFEYMSAGLPIVASDFPLWRNWLNKIDCGLLVDPMDSEAIARAIEYLLTHPDIAEEMGRKGQAAVRDRFNWETEAQALLELYGELA